MEDHFPLLVRFGLRRGSTSLDDERFFVVERLPLPGVVADALPLGRAGVLAPAFFIFDLLGTDVFALGLFSEEPLPLVELSPDESSSSSEMVSW